MKKFFWIGKDEAGKGRVAGDAKRQVEVTTSTRADATPTEVRSDPRAKVKVVTPTKGPSTKGKAPATGKREAKAKPGATGKHSSAPAAVSEPVVPPAGTKTREDDDTRPTRFSSAPPSPPTSPPTSPSTTNGAERVVVTCLACAAKNRVPAARLADRSRCARCKISLTPVTHVIPVEAESVLDAMAATPIPVLVWLSAAWSGPSSLLGLELDKLASERTGHLIVVRIDVDHRPNLARRYLVESVPTLVLLRRGREEGREVGVLPAAALRKRFNV